MLYFHSLDHFFHYSFSLSKSNIRNCCFHHPHHRAVGLSIFCVVSYFVFFFWFVMLLSRLLRHVVLTHVDAVRSWNSFDPGIFANLVLASFFRKMTATEQKLPSVSTANGTTMEDGGLPFSHALSWIFI